MTVNDLPEVNATLNGAAALLLLAGWIMIKRYKDEKIHRYLMVSALVCSAAFLSCYLVYHYHIGSKPFEGTGLIRAVYFLILVTHVPLAALMVPFILMAVWHAFRGHFQKHRRLVRWVWPVWMYVSVTGVIIYLMLYRM
ncbi:MAG: DUF420 domain-containing protein [Candidatus Hydrogenedentes bacterium]|nr:DUF420 domain-containing protein [Candidatus Hydrogenedentota bacterium]